jgi:hypothetical protein
MERQESKPRQINSRDMVLIRKQNAKMAGKLQPKWLGPYLATQTTKAAAYNLQDSEGNCNRTNQIIRAQV